MSMTQGVLLTRFGSHSTGYRITCVNVFTICIDLLDGDVLTAYLYRGLIDTQ